MLLLKLRVEIHLSILVASRDLESIVPRETSKLSMKKNIAIDLYGLDDTALTEF